MTNEDLVQKLKSGLDYEVLYEDLERKLDVKLVVVDPPNIPQEVKEYVDGKWAERLAKNPNEWEGTKYAGDIENIRVEGDKLIVPVYKTSFRYLLGTRFNQTPGFVTYIIGVGAITTMADDREEYFLFGERGGGAEFVGGRIDALPQGLIDEEEVIKQDPVISLMREGQEEIFHPLDMKLERSHVEIEFSDMVKTPSFANAEIHYNQRLEDCSILNKFTRQGDLYIAQPVNESEHKMLYAVPRQHLSRFNDEHSLGVSTKFRLARYLEREFKF